MVRKIFFLAFLLMSGGLILSSCTKEEELSSKKEVLSFVFEASKNATLEHNVIGDIVGTEIQVEVPFGTSISGMVPTIEISPRATLSPASGIAADFSDPVIYTVTAEDGTTKQFTTGVAVAPAPYIGTWTGGPIDFGLGLVHITVIIDAEANISIELEELLTHEISDESIKGKFTPEGCPDTDIMMEQTHRWVSNSWREESEEHTIRYSFEASPKMRFYYCICYPRAEWWYQIDLTRL